MSTKLQAPIGVTHIGSGGENYEADNNGIVTVPDALAKTLMASHGFVPEGSKPKVLVQAANDADMLTDDDTDYPSPSDFSAPLSQQQMKAFLRSEGVGIPKNTTVGALRALVETTYADALAERVKQEAALAHAEETKSADASGA